MGITEKRRLLKWLWIIPAVLVGVVAVAAVAAAVGARQFHESGVIARNVTIQGVDAGGMDGPEASRAVMTDWASQLPAEVTLRWPDGSVRVSPETLGARLKIEDAVEKALEVGREGGLFAQIRMRLTLAAGGPDIPVETTVDEDALEAFVIGLTAKVDRKPRNADIKVVGERVEVIPGEVGRHLDVMASIQALAEALTDPHADALDLVVKTQYPSIRAEDLQHLQVVLAEYTTRFKAHQTDRTHNLRLAMGNLSRAVLMPGDTLSFNERVGPRLIERGFREAPIFVDGEIEPATGGGVCQVATTVYNAALLANLDIRQRRHHSRPVDYAPSGRDATVYWGQIDLKIRNNLKRPVLFLGSIGGSSMTVKVLGSRDDKVDVEIVRSNVTSTAHETKEEPDPELDEGKKQVEKAGRNGVRVTVSRVVKKNGQVIRTERLHTDTYRPETRVVRVGTKPPEVVPEELEADPRPSAPALTPATPPAPAPEPAQEPAADRAPAPDPAEAYPQG